MAKKGDPGLAPPPPNATGPSHPPVGSLVDNNSLELVEVLGVGGYGVVYRAVDSAYALAAAAAANASSVPISVSGNLRLPGSAPGSPTPRHYAVKCLISSPNASSKGTSTTLSARRQLHIREFTLHQIASAHPSVATLHRVVEEGPYTFIVMDYASDHDLFTQILTECRYLGNDNLIKHVFLQILDAVEYCHLLGIYHRDLKPENILCFERGLRVAITDFGLATTDKMSEEYRTGSVYHMSPECQAAEPTKKTPYSPLHNDIWSLGIILLNLATGRNPWKSATPDDATFQAYKQDPYRFLPNVLPISAEFNAILVQTLKLDWKSRITIKEMRAAVRRVSTFYSANVVFEGSLARCPWESGMDLGNGVHTDGRRPGAQGQVQGATGAGGGVGGKGVPTGHAVGVNTGGPNRPLPKVPMDIEPYCVVSMSSPVVDSPQQWQRRHLNPEIQTIDMEDEDEELEDDDEESVPYDQSAVSDYSSDPSLPATPSSFDSQAFGQVHLGSDDVDVFSAESEYATEEGMFSFPYTPPVGDEDYDVDADREGDDEDDDRFASSVFLATPVCEQRRPDFAKAAGGGGVANGAASPYLYQVPRKEESPTRDYRRGPYRGGDVPTSSSFIRQHQRPRQQQIVVNHVVPVSPMVEDYPCSRPMNLHSVGGRESPSRRQHHQYGSQQAHEDRTRSPGLLNSFVFFPRSSATSWLQSKTSAVRHQPPSPPPQPAPPPTAAKNRHHHHHHHRHHGGHPHHQHVSGYQHHGVHHSHGHHSAAQGPLHGQYQEYNGRGTGVVEDSHGSGQGGRTRREWFSGRFFRN